MKDVKTYLNLVGNRLGKAFSIEEFSLEQELEFWSLSAEHTSRLAPPNFHDIAKWIDLLYRAPVHIVYRKKGEELFLFKRFINIDNLIQSDSKEALTESQKILISNFEQQVQNLQQKRTWFDEFKEHGVSSNSIGNCEHIPLFDKNREVWGLYIVGPNSKCPEVIAPKLSIVGRLLSSWLIKIEKEEEGQKNDYQNKMDGIVSNLGIGALNTEKLTHFFLLYLQNLNTTPKGAVVEIVNNTISIVTSNELSELDQAHILQLEIDQIQLEEVTTISIEKLGSVQIVPYNKNDRKGAILLVGSPKKEAIDLTKITNKVSLQVDDLLKHEDINVSFTNDLLNSYYEMLRTIERSRTKTFYHTPRLVSFAEKFAIVFGLDDQETETLLKTAKIHDIGYVGGLSVESEISIGSELSHPLTGYTLIDQLPIHEDIKKGVLSHHEWANGEGTPLGLETSEIPWTGKIISVFEYIVEFIESNLDDTSKTGEEWVEKLGQNLIERADVQFDMVLIPTVIQLIQMLGWENCCSLGTDD